MRLKYLLPLALPLVDGVVAATTKKTTTTTTTPTTKATTTTPPPANSALCSVVGAINSKLGPFTTISGSSSVSAAQCKLFCKQTTGCLSFAVSGGKCYLFKNGVASEYVAATKGIIYSFFDYGCSVTSTTTTPTSPTSPTSPTGQTTPTMPLPNHATTQVAQTFQAVTTPVPPSGDSPPLPPSSVVFPTDSSWLSTYTYENDPLPTVVSLGSAPNNNGLPAPSPTQSLACALDPASGAQFTLYNPSFVPIISKSGNFLGTLPTPTSSAQASALGYPGTLKAPQYSFKAASGAAAGVYDLVLSGSTPQYVALTGSGLAVLTSSSTGPNFVKRNGVSMVTSIFSIDCFGRILVFQGSTSYTWAVSGDYTTMTKGTPTNWFYAVQSTAPSPVPTKRSTPIERRRAKRDANPEAGAAPRCPARPPGLTPNLQPNAPSLPGQGCLWLSTGLYSVIEYNFDDDCNALDACYGNCAGENWEDCNYQFQNDVSFYTCDTQAISTDPLDWFSATACNAQMYSFYRVMSGDKGRQRFETIDSQQCSCYCPNSQSLCTDSSNNPYCIGLFGSDAGNCGACGRTCSSYGICKSGSCACPHDQCSNRCVDLRTSKTNCGTCGNVCDVACYQGQCYIPPPGCDPTADAITNGDFSNNAANWTIYSDQNPDDEQWNESDGLVMTLETPDDALAIMEFHQNAQFCASVTYELSFAMKHPTGSAQCTLRFWVAGYGVVASVNIPSSTSNSFVPYGPYTFPAPAPSDQTIDFWGDFTCSANGNNNMEIHVKGVQLVPT